MPLPGDLELVARLALAAFLGGLIGLEREINDHPAGLRTHVTVAIGSAAFVIGGVYGFEEFMAEGLSNVTVGVDRVASTVVTGIGFLGGGAILKHGATVRGLTTAASLWVTAAVGLTTAVGSYTVAVATTLATLAALVGLRGPERWVDRHRRRAHETVVIHVKDGSDPGGPIGALAAMEGVMVRSVVLREDDGRTVLEIDVKGPPDLETRVLALCDRHDVDTAEVS